jgi:hypothetical protein
VKGAALVRQGADRSDESAELSYRGDLEHGIGVAKDVSAAAVYYMHVNAIIMGEARKTVPRLRFPSISQTRKELPLAVVVAPEENRNCKATIRETRFHVSVFDGQRGRVRPAQPLAVVPQARKAETRMASCDDKVEKGRAPLLEAL